MEDLKAFFSVRPLFFGIFITQACLSLVYVYQPYTLILYDLLLRSAHIRSQKSLPHLHD